MKHIVSTSAALSVSAAALFVASTAFAAPGEGVRMGSFIVAPSIELEQRFDDNVFRQSDNKDSDTISRIAPQVEVRSDWNRHALSFSTGVAAEFHWENSDDNTLDANIGVDGEIDITRDVQLRLGTGYGRRHSNRGADDVVGNAAEPLVENAYDGEAELHMQFNRIGITVGGDIVYRDFENSDRLGGGQTNENDRDRVEFGGDLRIGFEARKGYEIFVFGRADQRDFDDAVDELGRNRDSDGYRVRAGIAFKPSRKLDASISAGFLGRSFDDPNFSDINSFDFAASLDWDLPNNLTNIGVDVTRNVADGNDDNTVAGRLITNAKLTVQHALTRAIELNGSVGYIRSEEDGNIGNREDDTYGIGIGMKYNVNRRLDVGAGYEYNRRVSNEVGNGFVSNVFALRANFKL